MRIIVSLSGSILLYVLINLFISELSILKYILLEVFVGIILFVSINHVSKMEFINDNVEE